MARIKTYNNDTLVSSNDRWIGTDGDNFDRTKNFSPLSLAGFFNSSETINSANSLTFTYQTLDPLEQRALGTISFKNNPAPQFNFSSINTIMFSSRSKGLYYVDVFLQDMVGYTVILHRDRSINDYGIYQVVSVAEDEDEPDFFNVGLLFLKGNGSLQEDKDYLFSVIQTNSSGPDLSQNNFVRKLDILEADLSGTGTIEEQICEYILLLPNIERTILETDSKWNVVILDGSIVKFIYEILNKGKGIIEELIPENLLLLKEGGGGAQTLSETLDNGNVTGGFNILINDADAIELENTSLLKKGTYDYGGNGGISRICSVGFEDMWQSGFRHVFDNNGLIRHSTNCFDVIPDETFDDTLRFKIDSLWTLDNGTTYKCTDASTGAAVWELYDVGGIPTLQDVRNENPNVSVENPFAPTANFATWNSLQYDDAISEIIEVVTIDLDTEEKTQKSVRQMFIDYVSHYASFLDKATNIFRDTFVGADKGKLSIFSRIRNQTTSVQGTHSLELDPVVGVNVVFKTASDETAGTKLLATREWVNGEIPTNTSDLVNDGENGTSPYVTADQLPSNLNLYATNVSSDIATYFKLVTSIDDPDYNDTAVDIPTGAITTTGQFIAALATTANVLVGNPGIINILTIGNVRRTSGTGTAEFYYEVYHRNSGGTETLIATSSKTPPVSTNVYTEFLAAALLNNGTFLATDRIVVKYYADRIAGGSNPNYDFQFGGTSPVRTNFPIPATNIPLDATPTDGSTNGVQSNGVFDALALKSNITVATTGVNIFFVTPQIYNTSSSPATANITNDLTGANLGVIQKIYHNHSVAPTVPGGWVLIGGEYKTSELNIIYAEWAGSSRVEYWIVNES
jgi:hypothetical protein